MVEPVSLQDTNRKSLQLWAAYASRSRAELESAPERVTLESGPERATLEAVPEKATLEAGGSHGAGCRCALCCARFGTTPAPLGGKIVKVNLSGELTEEEKRMVKELAERDAEVRRHEQAHLRTAGPYALGGPHYTYQVGPDGKRYAVGGEVQVDMSEVEGDPEATLRKAIRIQQAAMAPADPSAADRQVAMQAAMMAQEARQEMARERQEEIREQAEKQNEGDKKGDPKKIGSQPRASDAKTAGTDGQMDMAVEDAADVPSSEIPTPVSPSEVTAGDNTAALRQASGSGEATAQLNASQDASLDLYA